MTHDDLDHRLTVIETKIDAMSEKLDCALTGTTQNCERMRGRVAALERHVKGLYAAVIVVGGGIWAYFWNHITG